MNPCSDIAIRLELGYGTTRALHEPPQKINNHFAVELQWSGMDQDSARKHFTHDREDRMSTYDPLALLPRVPPFTLKSAELSDGGTLRAEHLFNGMGVNGGNRSPALEWSGFPASTRSFVVACHDPDAPTMSGFWHWMVVDIPAHITALPAGAGFGDERLPGGRHIATDFGTRNYGGAAPPPGHPPHRYIFVVHALSTPSLELGENATPAYVTFAAGFHVVARATLTTYFNR
jgi:hypothetical protein